MDDARFNSADIAAAAGINIRIAHNWVDRGIIEFTGADRKGRGKGDRNWFSTRSALRIRVIADLVRLGLTTSRAARVARTIENGREPLICIAECGAIQIGPDMYDNEVRLEATRRLASRYPDYKIDGPILFYDLTEAIAAVDAAASTIEKRT